jgi:polyferredoxin
MRIVTTRRICQIFFSALFIWFCLVSTLGAQWWQLRGWPVNWIIQLDPLVGLGTLLATGALYAGLAWGLLSIVLTVVLGRFFCGWVCPLGALQQFMGYLGKRRLKIKQKFARNQYHRLQAVKYWILVFLLASSCFELLNQPLRWSQEQPLFFWLLLSGLAALAVMVIWHVSRSLKQTALLLAAFTLLGVILHVLPAEHLFPRPALQIGLLDPIPLLYRSINLAILPLADGLHLPFNTTPRLYEGAWLIGSIFFLALFMPLRVPRFYCRFICPAGALFGILGRYAIWRIGKSESACKDCHICEKNCEGACSPSGAIRISECVLCLNCMADCHHGLMTYQTTPSAAGEITAPDLSRRAFMVSLASGAAAIPMVRLDGLLAENWTPNLVRPPGSLTEADFLTRCIKCGQCMRICPTNVIQPAGLEFGLEALWTPTLNFRIGSSGCQYKCIACSHICPTAAIRPITLAERIGQGSFHQQGPLKIGTAFVDRGRCLPWAMDRPCIVCQENCPVSPKAIFTRVVYSPIRLAGPLIVQNADNHTAVLTQPALTPAQLSTGDYVCQLAGQTESGAHPIKTNTSNTITLASNSPWNVPPRPGEQLTVSIRLQRPFIDIDKCIGCGVCEHECPVKGQRAIRITAENETRSRRHTFILTS